MPEHAILDLPVAREVASMIQLLPLFRLAKADLHQKLTNEAGIYADEKTVHNKDNETNTETINRIRTA